MTVTELPVSEQDRARLLELFVERLECINREQGRVLGTYQILEMLESIAVENRMIKCPCCGRELP